MDIPQRFLKLTTQALGKEVVIRLQQFLSIEAKGSVASDTMIAKHAARAACEDYAAFLKGEFVFITSDTMEEMKALERRVKDLEEQLASKPSRRGKKGQTPGAAT
jgi:hypothetical protein